MYITEKSYKNRQKLSSVALFANQTVVLDKVCTIWLSCPSLVSLYKRAAGGRGQQNTHV